MMTGGLPQPAISKIPVTQVAVEVYWFIWVNLRRIVGLAVFPLILCSVLIWFEDVLISPGSTRGFFEVGVSLVFRLVVILITIPYQVAIHRLAYPGFDFDRGSYGAPLPTIHKTYFLYTVFLSTLPAIILGLLYVFIKQLNSTVVSVMAFCIFIIMYIYVVVAFMLIFPEMAIGVKPDLVRVWWMLRGNGIRLVLTIILTIVPAFILFLIPEYLSDLFQNGSLLVDAIQIVIDRAGSLLILGLWASCLSICYFYVTGRQVLEGGRAVVTGDR